jgi:tRNA pseudouridine38-40 synthase
MLTTDLPIKRYFIYLAYKGTAYHGWQIQPNGITIQKILEDALSIALRNPINIVGAGRTDTGVHAKLMVAHFDFQNEPINCYELVKKLNSLLPTDISVSKIIEVANNSHARFDASSRTYEYHIIQSKDVFQNELKVQITGALNIQLMNNAASILLHHTDFTSFSKLHTDVKTNNCKIYHAQWTKNNDELIFTITADRFLRNMVRAIVGTLLEVGREKLTIKQFEEIIIAKNRCKAGVSVPAKGLFLIDIQYPNSVFIN